MIFDPTAIRYEASLALYEPHLTGDPERDAPWHERAGEMHMLAVVDGVRDVMISGVGLSQRVSHAETAYQLRHGFGRRLKFIWLALRTIIRLAPPDRQEPMDNDNVNEVARSLNDVYIHVRGAMDNLAWSLPPLYPGAKSSNPMSVDLLSARFLRGIGADDVEEIVQPFRTWGQELGARRNPAAHRIPLSVPPSAIDAQSRPLYEEAQRAYAEAQQRAFGAVRIGHYPQAEFDDVEAKGDALERIGKFIPVFVHHPEDGLTPIYPTVAGDAGEFALLAYEVLKLIERRSLATQ